MIALIVIGLMMLIVLSLFIFILVTCIKDKDFEGFGWVIFFFIVVQLLLTAWLVGSLYNGKLSNRRRKELLEKKQIIENCLIRKDSSFFYFLDEAEKHNNDVGLGNDLWHRFKKEDRSEYMIDIEYYKSTLINDGE